MQKNLMKEIFEKAFLPVAVLVFAVISYFAFYANLEFFLLKETLEYLDKWIFALFALIASFVLQRLVNAFIAWYSANIAKKTETSLDDEFLPLLKRLADFIIWVIAAMIVLSRFGINTSGIIAALGVGSLAIALAAQDTISNIISGFLIIVDRPFRIDDSIKLPSGEKVKVLEIGLRRSKFLAEDGAIIIVPNLELSKSKIVNFTYGGDKETKELR